MSQAVANQCHEELGECLEGLKAVTYTALNNLLLFLSGDSTGFVETSSTCWG
jgi:hypothetical protein